jgi:hypothetical protein
MAGQTSKGQKNHSRSDRDHRQVGQTQTGELHRRGATQTGVYIDRGTTQTGVYTDRGATVGYPEKGHPGRGCANRGHVATRITGATHTGGYKY